MSESDTARQKAYEAIDKYFDAGGPTDFVIMARHDAIRNNIISDTTSELRTEIHMKMLSKSDSAKNLGELTVIPLGFAVSIALEMIAAQRQRWEVAARKDELEQLKVEMRQHTVPESNGLITRSYLESTINFKIAQLGKEQ